MANGWNFQQVQLRVLKTQFSLKNFERLSKTESQASCNPFAGCSNVWNSKSKGIRTLIKQFASNYLNRKWIYQALTFFHLQIVSIAWWKVFQIESEFDELSSWFKKVQIWINLKPIHILSKRFLERLLENLLERLLLRWLSIRAARKSIKSFRLFW